MSTRLLWVVGGIAFLVFLYFTALPGGLPADTDDGPGIAGTYVVNGVDGNGIEYSGTAVIVALDADRTYDVEWIVTSGIHRGTGTVVGDEFSADWTVTAGAGAEAVTGRSVYTIGADGHLVGVRHVDGVDEPATEELFPDP